MERRPERLVLVLCIAVPDERRSDCDNNNGSLIGNVQFAVCPTARQKIPLPKALSRGCHDRRTTWRLELLRKTIRHRRKLVIEIDGDTHGRQIDYDAARTARIQAAGYRVIRFTNAEVMGNIEGVARVIETELGLVTSPIPKGKREQSR